MSDSRVLQEILRELQSINGNLDLLVRETLEQGPTESAYEKGGVKTV